jgi:hypothetical protein
MLVANDTSGLHLQVAELAAVVQNLTMVIASRQIDAALNTSVLQVFAVVPIVPLTINPTYTPPANVSYNVTQDRNKLIANSIPKTTVIFN